MTEFADETILPLEVGRPSVEATGFAGFEIQAGNCGIQVEFIDDMAALADLEDAWMDLAGRAFEASITLAPAMALAAIRNLQDAAAGSAILVWQHDNATSSRRLLALFPLQFSNTRWGIPVRSAVMWEHFYAIGSLPLIDKGLAKPAIAAFINWLQNDPRAPRFLRFSYLVKDPLHDLLTGAMRAHGMAVRGYDDHVRAILETDKPAEEYLRESLGKKRTKEYRRLRNRLGDLGEITFSVCEEKPAVEAALTRFLELEKSGWKGTRGTALDCRDDWRSFVEDSVSGLALSGQCRIAELCLDGRVIASTLLLISGDVVWMWKIAFDETLSKFSPGVLLVLDVTEHLIADQNINRLDSCAVADHPMINRIWRERLAVTDLLVTTRGGLVPGRLIEMLEQFRRDARAKIKAIYKRLVKETRHG